MKAVSILAVIVALAPSLRADWVITQHTKTLSKETDMVIK